jgi:uncharacterized protein (DUF305 family)|tara:strand:- start:41 stop:469 length:429 start_codon:yes stop_codon:yes gene_type:complete
MSIFFKRRTAAFAFTLSLTLVPFAASAQATFPEKCKAEMSMPGDMPMGGGMAMENMTDDQKEQMSGMQEMNRNMMQGMMKDDPDVSFACAMIAHHMGALHMAETELEHGDNEEMKAEAQKVLVEQTKEIETLTSWVEKEVKE